MGNEEGSGGQEGATDEATLGQSPIETKKLGKQIDRVLEGTTRRRTVWERTRRRARMPGW